MGDLSRFCCVNPNCPQYGQRDQGNVAVRALYGPHRRLLYCKTCKRRFSERKGTPLFQTRPGDRIALSVLARLQESCGVRQSERLLSVHRDTVTRLADAQRLLGGDAGLGDGRDPGANQGGMAATG
jgi:LacI family transcriptional regulator